MTVSFGTIDARRYRLRHVRPAASGVSVLGHTLAGEWLPVSMNVGSADLTEGQWTRRLGDAGEFSVTFPNTVASDGVFWRDRFDPSGNLHWIELYRGRDLEFVGVVTRVDVDAGAVTVSGTDGFGLLKRAYEIAPAGRLWRAPPRDVIHHYCGVPIVVVAEDFTGGALPSGWSQTSSLASTAFTADVWRVTATSDDGEAELIYDISPDLDAGDWRVVVELPRVPRPFGKTWIVGAAIDWGPSLARTVSVQVRGDGWAWLDWNDTDSPAFRRTTQGKVADVSGPMTVVLEARGDQVYGSVNGVGVGAVPNGVDYGREACAPAKVKATVSGLPSGFVVDVGSLVMTRHEPFLQGATAGGPLTSVADLPWGGLRGRYYNAADLAGLDSGVRFSIMNEPPREPYGERLDATLDTAGGLELSFDPGGSIGGHYGSQVWTGSIWLPASTVTFTIDNSTASGFTVEVNGTRGGDGGSSGGSFGTVVAADGWYPIVIRRIDNGTTTPKTWRMRFTVSGSGSYTDPGGTSVTKGSATTIPATSLSPYGLFEDVVTGQSHFDMARRVAEAHGLEIMLEPQSLESGNFPGLLVPTARVGRDTDLVLDVDADQIEAVVMTPAVSTDSEDETVHVVGNVRGLGGGRDQVIAETMDIPGMAVPLFPAQSWVDAADITDPGLLGARLTAELALRNTPWQDVRGGVVGHDGLRDSWPLVGTLEAFRWEPGDGVRLSVPSIAVVDDTPRRIVQITRSFARGGRTGAEVGFRNRPRGAAVALTNLARSTARPWRARAPQLITIDGSYQDESLSNGGAYSSYGLIVFAPGDRVVRAVIRLGYWGGNGLRLEVNGSDVTTTVGGPWDAGPLTIDIGAIVTPGASALRTFARFQNTGSAASAVSWQLSAEVLR